VTSKESPGGRSKLRQILTWAALLIALVGLFVLIRSRAATDLGLQDFVQYWAASRLNLRGSDPYDPAAMLAIERPLGWDEAEPNFMYNPPWMLALATPFAPLDYVTARTACMFLQFFAFAGLALVLWDDHGGPRRLGWLAGLLALAAFPTLITLRLGQSSLILLAGFVGFLHWEARGRDFLAGAALALGMVKPHLVYLIWPAVGIWSLRERRWGIVAGGAAMLGLLTIVAMVPNPDVFGQFRVMLRDRPPARFVSPTLGMFLRMAFGPENFRLQYVPMVAGFAWVAASWRSWLASGTAWRDRFAPILFASLLTTPYGAWATDMILLCLGSCFWPWPAGW
jgi:hypothetical protein